MPRAFTQVELPLLLPPDPVERRRRLEQFLMQVRSQPGVREAELIDDPAQPLLRLSINRRSAPLASLERLARHAGVELRQRYGAVVLSIEGMISPQSEQAIEAALAGLPGVNATASFPSRTVRVEFDRTRCQLPDIAIRLSRAGFRVVPGPSRPRPAPPAERAKRDLLGAWKWIRAHPEPSLTAVSAIVLLAGFIADQLGAPAYVTTPTYLLVYGLAGWHTARDTFLTLVKLKFNIDVLMFVAAIGAGILNHWAEGALLLVLFAIGHAGEDLAMERARRAFKALYDVAPDVARRKRPDGSIEDVKVEDLAVGDVVVVRPGDKAPADGAVVSGYSAMNQAALTGESQPVEKSAGSPVYAGAVNGDGSLEVRVERIASESTIARAIRLVEEAQTQKSPTELFTAAVERRYVPAVLVLTGLLLVVMPLAQGGDWEAWKTWFYRSMAFLTAASPCALAIGTPAAMLAALARAARMGILIKGGAHIETLGRLRVAAIDKTGTLTIGRPRVVEVLPTAAASAAELLAAAAAVEAKSSHPLAGAIVEAARAAGWDGRAAQHVEQVVGKGLRASLDGQAVEVGSPRLFEDADSRAVARLIEERHVRGETAVAVRRAGEFLGVIALADEPRPEAAAAVADLRALGVRRIVMLTGDNDRVAAALARRVGIDEVHASLLPEDKMRIVADLTRESRFVAMVGDGVNDAPALAAANVGVAMGAIGSDVALETADIALMHDDLSRFPEAVRLSKFARSIILQNLVIALGVIAVMAPLAALGYASIGWAVLFHEGSTVVVVLNGLRLLRFKQRAAGAWTSEPAPPSAAPALEPAGAAP